jgi:ketosteroid isomerase-like protein
MEDQLKAQLLGLERAYWSAVQHRDVDGALALTADPCLVAGSQGVAKVEKTQFRKIMEGARYRLHRFEIGDDAVATRISDDVALLAYTVREDLTVDGKQLQLEAADASVWVLHGGEWKCALHTESLRGDPYGRDRLTAA